MGIRVALAFAATGVVLALGAAAPAFGASNLQVGIADTAETLEQPQRAFPLYSRLRVKVLRVTLYWGSVRGVVRRRPEDGADPADPAYDWRQFDRAVIEADKRGIEVVGQIWGTPGWANGGNPPNRAPRNPVHLQAFAYAAATRYSGTFERSDGVVLPRVHKWIAWNEPNLRLGLVPQWRRWNGRWVPQSAYDYADICNAIYAGVHMTLLKGERVACGATAARGNNNPRARWASVGPMGFLRAMRRAGVRRIDAYAHHPYGGGRREPPWARPRNPTSVTLANINSLARAVSRAWGRKPIWVTEYGYETAPPDPVFGVSWRAQARYLTAAFEMARRNPRIEMMMWFLVRDEARSRGWQSGLISSRGIEKPAFVAFQREARRIAASTPAAAPAATSGQPPP